MIKSADLLKNYGLRQTEFRRSLISLFYRSNSLTAEDIKNKINVKSDKVTIYRALESFEKSGLIHKVPDHMHNHAHFICTSCSDTFCIQEIQQPIIKKSVKYTISEIELTLKGLCANCK